MTETVIDELAAASGVARAARLRPSEVVEFEVHEDCSFRFVTASGEVIHSVSVAMLEAALPSMSAADLEKIRPIIGDMMRMVRALETLAPPDIQFGVPVYRREIVKANGQRSVAFVEAGR